jgi:hypothetical protein
MSNVYDKIVRAFADGVQADDAETIMDAIRAELTIGNIVEFVEITLTRMLHGKQREDVRAVLVQINAYVAQWIAGLENDVE